MSCVSWVPLPRPRRSLGLPLLDQLADLLELWRSRDFAPVEKIRFSGDDCRAAGGHAIEGDLPVALRPARDGIRRDVDLKTISQKVEHGLQHTDMGFDARDDDLKAIVGLLRACSPVED